MRDLLVRTYRMERQATSYSRNYDRPQLKIYPIFLSQSRDNSMALCFGQTKQPRPVKSKAVWSAPSIVMIFLLDRLIGHFTTWVAHK